MSLHINNEAPDFTAESGAIRHAEASVPGIDEIPVKTRLQIHIQPLDQRAVGQRRTELQGRGETRAEVRAVGHDLHAVGPRKRRHFEKLADATHLGNTGLRVGNGAG